MFWIIDASTLLNFVIEVYNDSLENILQDQLEYLLIVLLMNTEWKYIRGAQ